MKKTILSFLVFLLLSNSVYAIGFSYIPRMTLYGEVGKPIEAETRFSNPNNINISVNLSYDSPYKISFLDGDFFELIPNKSKKIRFEVVPNKSGVHENLIIFNIEENNVAFHMVVITNIEEGKMAIKNEAPSTELSEASKSIVWGLYLIIIMGLVAFLLKNGHRF